MSTFWKPPLYGVQGRELQWLNNTVQAHEIFCGCDTPIQHFVFAFTKRATNYGLTADNLDSMRKCLTFTQDAGTQTDGTSDEEDGIGGPEGDLSPGDLDKLFEGDDPFTTEDTG